MLACLIFMLGTGIGAVCRFTLTNLFKQRHHGQRATLIVNLSGCLIGGLILGCSSSLLPILLILGFIGGLTTYSTFNSEIANAFWGLKFKNAILYFLISYGGGLLLCYLGYLLTNLN
ncbi:fluoride efflux transporter FluC [Fructilactobacillus frigidiflavus]|uniref:fluoride efflux transporter FluC n=1 Tax=Fructilactobacillus frigidiflavus TaxID=3242688 RepID=UPI003757C1ED